MGWHGRARVRWKKPDCACIEGVNDEPSHDTAQAAREEADGLNCDDTRDQLLSAEKSANVSVRIFNISNLTVGRGGFAAAATIDLFSEAGCADAAHIQTRAISADQRAGRGSACTPQRPCDHLRASGDARLTHCSFLLCPFLTSRPHFKSEIRVAKRDN